MKYSTILLSLAFSVPIFAQQSEIKGVISIHNSEYETGKRQYVANAQVEDDFAKANPQTTDATGNFKLVFVRIPEKTSVQLIVKKEDLQVVNIDGLSAVTGQRDLVRLSMAKPDKIAQYRREIYQVGKTEAEKNLAAQLKKKGEQITAFQKDAVKNKTVIENLQKEYAELQAFAFKIEEQAQDLARRYAPINLDDAAPLYRESFKLFQQGELSKALQILRGAGLIKQANNIFAERKNIKNIRNEADQRDSTQQQRTKDLIQVLGLKADLHKAKFEWDSVLFCLQLRVNLDSTNVDNLGDFAFFLSKQNKKHEASTYLEKALILTQRQQSKVVFLNMLGTLYSDNQKMVQAEVAYNEALKISRQLADKNPDAFLMTVPAILNNLGKYYIKNNKMVQAEAAYEEALMIFRQLMDKNPEVFLPAVSTTLNNLGDYYRANQRMIQAEAAYLEALDIIRELVKNNPNTFWYNLASTLNSLGNYYFDNKKIEQAGAAYLEAVKILWQMADNNPDAFLPDLALTLNSLGHYYHFNQKMIESEIVYAKALKIFRQLADKSPDAFLFCVAGTLHNLGVMYDSNQKMIESEAAYLEALKIRRQLADKNPDAFLPDLALTLNNLAFLKIGNPEEAEKYLNESLMIRRKLAQANPAAQNLELARTLIIGGLVCEGLKNIEQSQNYFKEALSITEKYPEVTHAQYLIKIIKERIKK